MVSSIPSIVGRAPPVTRCRELRPSPAGGVRFRFGLRFGGADGPCWALCSAKVPRAFRSGGPRRAFAGERPRPRPRPGPARPGALRATGRRAPWPGSLRWRAASPRACRGRAAREDGPENGHPRHPGQGADAMLELALPLRQRLLPLRARRPRRGQEHGPLPQRPAPPGDWVGRPQRPGEEAEGGAALYPRALVDVTLGSSPARLDLVRLHAEPRAAARLQQLQEWEPRDARRCEGHWRDATQGPPGGPGFQGGRGRPAAAHGLGSVTRGHGHTMRVRPAVDACRLQGASGQWRRAGGRSLRGFLLAWRPHPLHKSTVRGGAVGAGAAEWQHAAKRDQGQACHH